ncbi:hypothetical protein BJX62DRAFT_50268 [Aspergillus germanicus]
MFLKRSRPPTTLISLPSILRASTPNPDSYASHLDFFNPLPPRISPFLNRSLSLLVSDAHSNRVIKTINACRARSFALSQVTSPVLVSLSTHSSCCSAPSSASTTPYCTLIKHLRCLNCSRGARALCTYLSYASTTWKRARSIAAHVDFSPAVYDATAPTISSAVQSSSSPPNTLRSR